MRSVTRPFELPPFASLLASLGLSQVRAAVEGSGGVAMILILMDP